MKKWIVGSTIAAAAIASVLFFSTYSLGTTRYVDNTLPGGCSNGSITYDPAGTGSCGSGSARIYSSIANALNAGTTVAGDTLYIRAGNYAELIDSGNTPIPSGTSWANAPIISAYPSETVTIVRVNLYATSPVIDYLIFQNLILDPNSNHNEGVYMGNGTNHVRFIGCEIKNASREGVLAPHGTDGDHEFINCHIHNNGTALRGHGLYLSSSNNLVDNCDVHHNASSGIQIYNGYGESANNNTIKNSRFYNNGTSPQSYLGYIIFGIVLASGTGNTAYNNLCYNSDGGGIQATSGGNNSRIYNNTIYGNTSTGYAIDIQTSGTIVRNNIMYNNGLNSINGSPTQSNNLTTNPSFVAPTATPANFHLQAGSAAINAGCTSCSAEMTAIFTTDKDGVARNAVPWDVGAYEYDTSGGTPSITISSPASGAPWNVGTQQTITWSCPVGCAGPIDINIDRANAGTFTESIIQNYPLASGSSYTWTVTGSGTDNQVKIRVQDNDATPTATTANFTIQASGGGGANPIISDNTTGTKAGTIPGVEDTYLFSLGGTSNYGADQTFYVSKDDATHHNHGLLRFTGLSQIPSTSTISSVTLGLYVTESSATGQTFDLRRVLRTWVEGTGGTSGASWTNYNSTTAWQTAGGLGALDRVSTAVGQWTGLGASGAYATFTDTGTFKTFIQNIVSGTAPNEGFHLEDTTEGNGYIGFVSSDGPNGQRPYLELVLTTAAPTIVVTEPKSGDLFLSGQTGPVRWTSQGISGNVRIDLSRDGGTTWETITASTGFNDPDELVTYNAPTSSNCKIRVVSLNDTAILGTSGGSFRIGGTRAGFTLVP